MIPEAIWDVNNGIDFWIASGGHPQGTRGTLKGLPLLYACGRLSDIACGEGEWYGVRNDE